jgi:hypothetical protein
MSLLKSPSDDEIDPEFVLQIAVLSGLLGHHALIRPIISIAREGSGPTLLAPIATIPLVIIRLLLD